MPSDTTPPTLTGLKLPTTIDVTAGGAAASFSALASDVGAGVAYVGVYLDHAVQTSSGPVSYLAFTDGIDSFADGVSSLTQWITPTAAAGAYDVTQVVVGDKAGNTTTYDAAQLAQMGIATGFTVQAATPVTGTSGNDVLTGTSANERFTGGLGDDRIDGGGGIDTAVFGSSQAGSSVDFAADGSVVVTGSDGRDTLLNIEKLQFADGSPIDVAAAAPVGALYAAWAGRDASAAELAYWSGRLATGLTTLAGVKAAILADPLGTAHTDAVVTALYQDLGGRAPTAAELSTWEANVRAGSSFDDVRQAILHDPLGAAAVSVTGLYETYMGRAPSDAELGVWTPQVKAGLSLGDVRGAILDDASGRAHTDATVAQLYQTYGGRAPTAAELGVWEANVRAGANFDDVRHAILADPLGANHTDATIAQLYQAEFGRAASAGELSAWRGLVAAGATFDTALDTLIADHGSDAAGTVRLAGTAGADAFVAGAGHETDIAGFDPAHDTLTLPAADVADANALDAAHARQVYALDGTPDVLFTLDDGHHVLLQHVLLGDLGTGDIHLA